MEEIKIYHSVIKSFWLLLGGVLFVAFGVWVINMGYAEEYSPKDQIFFIFFGWLSIIFFGIGSLVYLYQILNEKIFKKPYITITDTCLEWNHKFGRKIIYFRDVESFSIYTISSAKGGDFPYIGLRYRNQLLRKEPNFFVRIFNKKVYDESIPVQYLTLKPQEICDILNNRLKK